MLKKKHNLILFLNVFKVQLFSKKITKAVNEKKLRAEIC